MLFVNLNVLLAERNLRISKVSKDTGISRTTLTALCNNYSQGVQFDTLNLLCSYLGVTPAQFFVYLPTDYELNVEQQDEKTFLVRLSVNSGKRKTPCAAFAYVEYDKDTAFVTLSPSPEAEDNSAFLQSFLSTLPPIAKETLANKICNCLGLDNYSVTLIWDI